MTHEEAIEKSQEFQYLVEKPFLNSKDEKETIKAVVAWDEGENSWYPHVCFYNWAVSSQGQMSHMRADDFLNAFQMLEES